MVDAKATPEASLAADNAATNVVAEPAAITAVETASPVESKNKADNLQQILLITSLFCGVFVMALDSTIIGTVVPIISAEFNALNDIAWYGSGYLLTITALQPTFGKLYRVADIKLSFMGCIVVFEGRHSYVEFL
jgi:hypothetical protein